MSPKATRFRAVLTTTSALALILCTAACNSRPVQNMTEDEATEKVQEHIDGALTALPGTVELDPLSGPVVGGCDGGGEDEDVTVSHAYWLRELPTEDNEGNAELLLQYWSDNGYETLRDRRPDKLSISVENTEDAFRMSLRESDQGTLSIGASSPCVPRDDPR